MKKIVISCVIALLVCVSISIFMNVEHLFGHQEIGRSQGEVPRIPQSEPETIMIPDNGDDNKDSQSSLTYIVKAYNGKVCVFEKGEEKPFKITDCSVKDLPACDRETLEKGIEIVGESELARILEDYCG